MSLLLVAPMLLVFGTTMMVSLAGGTLPDAKSSFKALAKSLTGGVAPAGGLVPTVVSLAEKARREGLLALEDSLREVDDPFLVKGVSMAIDGTDSEELRDILEAEVSARKASAKQGAKFFADAGAYAPTIGIIGTVMGLVHVLENLAQPEELGHLIAGAFVATLWGVISANVIWLPLGNRIKRLGELEVARMELAIEGIAAIQSGANPRIVAQKLRSLLPAERAGRGKRPDMGRRKRHEEHEEHVNHERWLVTYADMVTLLMVLFIVMFAMSAVDEKKFNALKSGLAAGFGQSTSLLSGSSSIQQNAGLSAMAPVAPASKYQQVDEVTKELIKKAVQQSNAMKNQANYEQASKEVDRLSGVKPGYWPRSRRMACRTTYHHHRRERAVHPPGQQARHLRGQPGDPEPPRGTDHRHPGACPQGPARPDRDRGSHQPGQGEAEVLRHRLGSLSGARDHRPAAPERGRRHPQHRLHATAYGHEKPLVDPSEPGSQEINKRVDIIIVSSLPPESQALLGQVVKDRARSAEGVTTP